MKVRLKQNLQRSKYVKFSDFTPGNVYFVIGIEAGDYRIMNDCGQPYLYPADIFEVLDPAPGKKWQRTLGDEGELYCYPPELGTPGFFEDYFEGNRRAHRILEQYLVAARKHPRRPGTRAA